MKAVVLAAGKPRNPNWFPPNAKPKCLFHVGGEVLLSRIVRSLRDAGVSDVRVVVGYRREDIERFNEEKELGLELVYNPLWEADAVASVLRGIKGVEDDVLLISGDIIIDSDLIARFLERDEPLIEIKLKTGGRDFDPVVYRGDRRVDVVKVARDKLWIFETAYEDRDRFLVRYPMYRGLEKGCGIEWGALLLEALHRYGPPGHVLIDHSIMDVDFYRQTDEARGLVK